MKPECEREHALHRWRHLERRCAVLCALGPGERPADWEHELARLLRDRDAAQDRYLSLTARRPEMSLARGGPQRVSRT